MAPLSEQVALVTGCSTGIGKALARALKTAGHRVFASARRLESVADLAAEGIETLRLDVNDPASIHAAVDTLLARAGRLDVLVNNAGINVFGPLVEVPLDKIRATLETNVIGLVAVTQAVFPTMAAQRSGRIVNVGSIVGVLATPFAATYCASKAAVHSLSEALRMEVKPFGIDVVVVQPGGVKSSIADSAAVDIDRYQSAQSLYRRVYDGIRKRAYASQDGAMETDDFAREVVRRALATPAPRIVRLGAMSSLLPSVAKMPGAMRDRILSTMYLLDRKLP